MAFSESHDALLAPVWSAPLESGLIIGGVAAQTERPPGAQSVVWLDIQYPSEPYQVSE